MAVMELPLPQPTPARARHGRRREAFKCERKTSRGLDAVRSALKSRQARDSLHRFSVPPDAIQRRRHPGRSCESEHAGGALKAEVRRLAAKEVQKGLRSLRTLQRQMKKLRLAARANRRGLRAVERSFGRLESRVPSGGRRGRGARLSGEDIRALRARLRMTREQFSRLLGVSPGSIFGWETGRTVPRGRSMARVLEVRKMGVRRARAQVAAPAPRRGPPGAQAARRAAAQGGLGPPAAGLSPPGLPWTATAGGGDGAAASRRIHENSENGRSGGAAARSSDPDGVSAPAPPCVAAPSLRGRAGLAPARPTPRRARRRPPCRRDSSWSSPSAPSSAPAVVGVSG